MRVEIAQIPDDLVGREELQRVLHLLRRADDLERDYQAAGITEATLDAVMAAGPRASEIRALALAMAQTLPPEVEAWLRSIG